MKLPVLLSVAMAATISSAFAANPVPASGGRLPWGQNSDQLVWEHFADIVSLTNNNVVEFETWASDEDVYQTTPPVWPDSTKPPVKHLHPGLLQRATMVHPTVMKTESIAPGTQCSPVGAPAAGNFPTTPSGGQSPCYAEEVRRDRRSFDYIVANNLYSTQGLANWATNKGIPVSLPWGAMEVKADWVPIKTLVQWLGMNGKTITEQQALAAYYTTVSDGVTYGLAGLHISSKEIPIWVWATFEHQYNPGRCDTMGCHDSFGAKAKTVPPKAGGVANTQYPACVKTAVLQQLFDRRHLSKVWDNYCLKASEIAFTAPNGAPLIDGNSFTERVAAAVPINTASCTACHASAGFNKNGSPYTTILGTSPIGYVKLPPDVIQNDFIWGILQIQ